MRQDLSHKRAWHYIRGLLGIQSPMESLKSEQKLYQPLKNLRVVMLEPNERHLADMAKQREDGTPAITVAYIADCSTTGRGDLPGAVTLLRTYAIGPTGSAPNTDPNSKLYVLIRTGKMQSTEWHKILERSKELGHMAIAGAIATAFHGGLPSLGKRS